VPKYLTCPSLHNGDATGPVHDSLDARLAAWNAGAVTVRQAYRQSQINWMRHLPKETRTFISRYHRLADEVKNQKSKIKNRERSD
jgi:hypothetical protein